MDPVPDPDLNWYVGLSQQRGAGSFRCPFASVERCPRYYQSLSLLGTKVSTKISPEEDDRLLKHWEKSELWPRIGEYATAIAGGGDNWSYINFCPEISYDIFGFFAEGFGTIGDEIDREFYYKRLNENPAEVKKWQWSWAYVKPLHFTECPLYSPLSLSAPKASKTDERREEPITLRPTFMGMSVNLNEVWRRVSKRLWGQRE
jgi:hypothetical protein